MSKAHGIAKRANRGRKPYDVGRYYARESGGAYGGHEILHEVAGAYDPVVIAPSVGTREAKVVVDALNGTFYLPAVLDQIRVVALEAADRGVRISTLPELSRRIRLALEAVGGAGRCAGVSRRVVGTGDGRQQQEQVSAADNHCRSGPGVGGVGPARRSV